MYEDYCAVCHGMDGKGDGPAVQFLKAPPPDLTTIAKRYNEKQVALRVTSVLRFGTGQKGHGTLDMPVWGDLFYRLENRNGHPDIVRMRISNLSEFVQSMQSN
jgi:mono/diheme cytochrome c family protein